MARMTLRHVFLFFSVLCTPAAFAADCGYELIPEWETLRTLRSEFVADPYAAALAPETQQIDSLFQELDRWIADANRVNRDHCEPFVQRLRAFEARKAAIGARCQGEIADKAVYDSCVAEQSALNQEMQAGTAVYNAFNAALVPLNTWGLDLVARTQAATRTLSALSKDSAAMLTRYVRHVQAQGGTANSCRSLGEIITTVVRRNGGNSTRTIDDLATALTSAGGSGFTASGFRPEFRISGDPVLRTVTWLALGYRGGATGDDPLNRAAAELGIQLRQSGNAAGLGASVRARLCGP